MTNTIQINCEHRFITHKDKDFIGISGENNIETLKIELDEERITENITPYLEVEFPDNTKGIIKMNKFSDTEAEIGIKNSLLKQEGCLKLEFVLVSKDTTVFKSVIFELKVLEAINATETLEEDYPNVFQDIEEMRKDIEKLKENGRADLTEILADINNLKVSEEQQNNKITLLETQSGSKINLNINTTDYVMTLELLNSKNEVVSSKSIDFPLESMVVNGRFENNNIILTLQNGNEVSFSVAALVNGLIDQETFDAFKNEINQKFTELEIYSTEEKIIGKWIDGKPLYQKVITNLAQLDAEKWSKTNISSLNVDKIIDIRGQVITPVYGVNTTQPIPRVVPDAISQFGIGFGDMNRNQIGILFGTNYTKIVSGFLILKYTKIETQTQNTINNINESEEK